MMKYPLILCFVIGSTSLQACAAISAASKVGAAVSKASKAGAVASEASKASAAASEASKVGAVADDFNDTSKAGSKISEGSGIADDVGKGTNETSKAAAEANSATSGVNGMREPLRFIVTFTDEEKRLISLGLIDELPVHKQNLYNNSLRAALNQLNRVNTDISIDLATKIAERELKFYCAMNQYTVDEQTADFLTATIGTAAYTAYSLNKSSNSNSG